MVSRRLGFASYTNSRAQVDVTGVQKEQSKIAKEAFEVQQLTLAILFNTKLPALEKEYENIGGILYNNSPRYGIY